jgi:sterol-4alpha-carboxylate 3-dehydrogenase (decarboxylating)
VSAVKPDWKGELHFITEEDAELINALDKRNPYPSTKAKAERVVLKGDNEREAEFDFVMKICCLRFPAIYGARDFTTTLPLLEPLKDGTRRYQVGDKNALSDWVYVENAADAHVLAAQKLLASDVDRDMKVDGEAFFITDDNPMPFWEFVGKLRAAAGYELKEKDLVHIPRRLALRIEGAIEWAHRAFKLRHRQRKMSRWTLEWYCRNRTYCIDKAKERLDYLPKVGTDEGIKRAVEWAIKYQEENLEKETVKSQSR